MFDLNNVGTQPPIFEDAEERKDRLRNELQRNIRGVVRSLFPKARFGARDARIGDIHGTPGQSLSIAITAAEAGMWFDHATGEKGDVFELVAAATGSANFSDTLAQCETLVGGSYQAKLQHTQPQPRSEGGEPPVTETLTAKYHYRDIRGKKICTAFRYDLSNGKKRFGYQQAGGERSMPSPRPLYRLDKIHDQSEIIFVEGEKCADALAEAGIEATTVMGGANTKLSETDFTPITGKRVLIWPDNDSAGHEFADKIVGVLADYHCSVRVLDVPDGKPEKWDAADAIEEGFDVFSFIKAAPEKPRRTLPILSVSDLAGLTPPSWLISDFMTENGLSVLYGASGSFKSFVALDMALCIATGQEWRGRKTLKAPVIYVIGEGVGGWPARVFTWMQERSEGAVAEFYTVPQAVPITEADDLSALVETITGVCERPGLIVLDTLARNFGSGDENSTQDMSRFITSIDKLRDATGAHVCLVHHTGKDSEKGARGSSVLRAALDTELHCNRISNDQKFVRLITTKQKDADQAEEMLLEMVSCEAAHPTSGEVLTSLIPVLRDKNIIDSKSPQSSQDPHCVLRAVLATGPKTMKELEDGCSKSRAWVQKYIAPMVDSLEVFSVKEGKTIVYGLSEQGGT